MKYLMPCLIILSGCSANSDGLDGNSMSHQPLDRLPRSDTSTPDAGQDETTPRDAVDTTPPMLDATPPMLDATPPMLDAGPADAKFELAPGVTCDIQSDTGCGPTERCTYHANTSCRNLCDPAGSAKQGEPCPTGYECAKGYVCKPAGLPSAQTCAKVCYTSADCADGYACTLKQTYCGGSTSWTLCKLIAP